MKVLFVSTTDISGGAARAAMRIMRGVQQCEIEVLMFVKHKYSQFQDVVAEATINSTNILRSITDWIWTKILNKQQQLKWHPYKQAKKKYYLSDARGCVTAKTLREFDYDVLHLHWINMRFIDVQQLRKIHKPIVWTLHDSWAFTGICHVPYECKKYESHCGACPMLGSEKEKDLAYEVFEQKMEAYMDLNLHIVTPSRWLGDCVKRSALLRKYPVTVIPNCIDTDLYQPIDKSDARKVLGLDTDKTYLLFGAMHVLTDANKGFAYLKEALKLVLNAAAELLVYGTNDDMQRYNLPLQARSMGYISNDKIMSLLYNASDVTIVPSLSENLSNTIMESLSCGTPVVAFNIGGNGDMIDHMRNGYLAAERDCKDLAKGIEWCVAHNADESLGENARKKVMDNYTIDIVSEKYKQLYESLL